MPLRKVQNLEDFAFGHIYYDQIEVNPDTGKCKTVTVDQCVILPDKKMTDLGTMLNAGVDLQLTNSKLLNPIVAPAVPDFSATDEPKSKEA